MSCCGTFKAVQACPVGPGCDTCTLAEGHELDANTVALWRFDETRAIAAWTTLEDSGPNSRDLTVGNATNGPRPWSGQLGAGTFARRFSGTNATYTANAGADEAAFANSWTLTAWVRWPGAEGSAGERVLLQYGQNIATAGSTCMVYCAIRGSSNPGALYSLVRNAGVNSIAEQSLGTVVPSTMTWTHIAMVHNRTNQTVLFYVNGVLQQTVGLSNPVGAGNAQYFVGGDPVGGNNFRGIMRMLTATPSILTAQEILDLYNNPSSSPPGTPIVQWNMDEPPDLIDEVGTYHCNTTDTSVTQFARAPGLVQGRAIYGWKSANTISLVRPKVIPTTTAGSDADLEALRALWQTRTWSLEWWQYESPLSSSYVFDYFNGSSAGAMSVRGNGSGSTPGGTATHGVQWRTAANVLVSVDTGNQGQATYLTEAHHLAVTCEPDGASNQLLRFYRDGVEIYSLGGQTGYNQTTSAAATTQAIGVVGLAQGGSPANAIIDDMRLSNVTRSQAEIQASYERGLGQTYERE